MGGERGVSSLQGELGVPVRTEDERLYNRSTKPPVTAGHGSEAY